MMFQGQKTLTVAGNDAIEFMVAVKNSSNNPLNNVTAQITLPTNVVYTGNLTIDGAASAGNIGSGISLGTINAHTSKIIIFTGNVQAATADQTLPVTATVNSSAGSDSDSVSLSLKGSETTSSETAAVSNSAFTGIFNFFKTWYLWIIVIIVMIILFVIIFRRLSSPT